ncbi:MAG: hypothetical protein K6G11_10560 [Lachnospiraceae bacterium]|nr:hypothetical protein [Lachnospiraceae bacterium]
MKTGIYIFTALEIEARQLIREYGLKKSKDNFGFTVYENTPDLNTHRLNQAQNESNNPNYNGTNQTQNESNNPNYNGTNLTQNESNNPNYNGTNQAQNESNNSNKFRYNSLNIRLITTGVGPVAAATAVGATCAFYRVTEQDVLVNYGCAGAENPSNKINIGDVYLINKLVNSDSGFTFYPDIENVAPSGGIRLAEATVHTSSKIFTNENPNRERNAVAEANFNNKKIAESEAKPNRGKTKNSEANPNCGKTKNSEANPNREKNAEMGNTDIEYLVLHDMEAAAVYQAGSKFFTPGNMHFIKVVSDTGENKTFTKDEIISALEKNFNEMKAYLYRIIEEIKNIRFQNSLEMNILKNQNFCGYKSPGNTNSPGAKSEELQNSPEKESEKFQNEGKLEFEDLFENFKCSETMKHQLNQLLQYCEAADIDAVGILENMKKEKKYPCETRRDGKKALSIFYEQIIYGKEIDKTANLQGNNSAATTDTIRTNESDEGQNKSKEDNNYNKTRFAAGKPFTHIYVEKNIINNENTKQILSKFKNSEVVIIDHYKDIFCRNHQDYRRQATNKNLILAEKQDNHLYKGAPVCQSFGNEHFYYTSNIMNCLYDCEYCYLKGMYDSANIVIFVNLEDTFREIENVLKEHDAYISISYDSDLLALDGITGFVRKWTDFVRQANKGSANSFGLEEDSITEGMEEIVKIKDSDTYAGNTSKIISEESTSEELIKTEETVTLSKDLKSHNHLTIEIRTKCGRTDIWNYLEPDENVIFAFTISPEKITNKFEHKTSSLKERIISIKEAIQKGFKVRICIDPIIYQNNWKKEYSDLINLLFEEIDVCKLKDVSVGSFRISKDYLKQIRKKLPDSEVVQFPFELESGYYHYPSAIMNEMEQFVVSKLEEKLPSQKIFLWEEQ